MAQDDNTKEDKFEFDSAGQELAYIGLDHARVLAIRHARDNPEFYGERYSGVSMVSELISAEESDYYYDIKLSFRPAGRFRGEPGIEQFIIDKTGVIEVRQMLDEPTGLDTPEASATTPPTTESTAVPDPSESISPASTRLDDPTGVDIPAASAATPPPIEAPPQSEPERTSPVSHPVSQPTPQPPVQPRPQTQTTPPSAQARPQPRTTPPVTQSPPGSADTPAIEQESVHPEISKFKEKKTLAGVAASGALLSVSYSVHSVLSISLRNDFGISSTAISLLAVALSVGIGTSFFISWRLRISERFGNHRPYVLLALIPVSLVVMSVSQYWFWWAAILLNYLLIGIGSGGILSTIYGWMSVTQSTQFHRPVTASLLFGLSIGVLIWTSAGALILDAGAWRISGLVIGVLTVPLGVLALSTTWGLPSRPSLPAVPEISGTEGLKYRKISLIPPYLAAGILLALSTAMPGFRLSEGYSLTISYLFAAVSMGGGFSLAAGGFLYLARNQREDLVNRLGKSMFLVFFGSLALGAVLAFIGAVIDRFVYLPIVSMAIYSLTLLLLGAGLGLSLVVVLGTRGLRLSRLLWVYFALGTVVAFLATGYLFDQTGNTSLVAGLLSLSSGIIMLIWFFQMISLPKLEPQQAGSE